MGFPDQLAVNLVTLVHKDARMRGCEDARMGSLLVSLKCNDIHVLDSQLKLQGSSTEPAIPFLSKPI